MDIADELTKKAGPLPVWAWLGIGGGVLLLILRGGGGGGSSTSSTTPAVGPNGVLDTSGLGSGALDLGAIAPVAPLVSVGGDAGGFEDPIATPATSVPAPVGGGSPDQTSSLFAATPYLGAIQQATLPPGSGVDYNLIAQQLPLSQAPEGFQLEKTILANPQFNYDALNTALGIPTAAEINAQIMAGIPSNEQLFGNTPTFDTFAADNSDATHVLVQPAISPAGTIAFATTPQTAQPNGNVVVQASSFAGAPETSHPDVTPRATLGHFVAV